MTDTITMVSRHRPVKQPHAERGVDHRTWSRHATPEEVSLASRALAHLECHRNVIVLVPAPDPHFDGHKIRAIECRNPDWYIEFGRGYWRGPRSFQLKRLRVIKALQRVVSGWVRGNGYERMLLPKLAENRDQLPLDGQTTT